MTYSKTVVSKSHAHSITGGVVRERIVGYLDEHPRAYIFLLKNGEQGSELTDGKKLIDEFMSIGIEEGDSVEIKVDECPSDVEEIIGEEIANVLETFDTKAYVEAKKHEVFE